MNKLSIILLSFCALSLNYLNASGAPGGADAGDAAARKPYFQHDYVTGQQLPAGHIKETAQRVSAPLYAAATRLGHPVADGDLLFLVDDRSTDASVVNSLLVARGNVEFDAQCEQIKSEAERLQAEIMAAFGSRIIALQQLMRAAARSASQVSIDADKIAEALAAKK